MPDWPALAGHRRPSLLLRQTIDERVLPHLLKLHPPAHPTMLPVDPERIAALAHHAAKGDPASLFSDLEMLRDAGTTADALCLEVLAPAARHLGELWERDEFDFVEVTIGVTRLQQALRRLAPAHQPKLARRSRLPSILMLPVPGEHHHFGLAMAADFFRRAG